MNWLTILQLASDVLTVVGTSAVAAAVLPKSVVNAVPAVGSVLNTLAANVGNAKNR